MSKNPLLSPTSYNHYPQPECSYQGNPKIKKHGVKENWTPELITEYKKCSENPIYFIKNYMMITSLDDGLVPFELYPYQEDLITHFHKNIYSCVLSCRQSGKTISIVAYILWYSLFHSDKMIFVLANKMDTARDVIFARYVLALENIPYIFQPGVRVLNKSSVEFSTNTKIFARATSSSSIRGNSANLIALDEFAFIDNSETFFASTYPVISSGKNSKVLISSTPNGYGNMFYKIWQGAISGTNEFKPFTINWWDVPGRDEEWKRKTIANTSERQFDQEFNISFLGSSKTLISGNVLLNLIAQEPSFSLDNDSVLVYEEPVIEHNYIMTVDVSKGRGQDYSTFTVIDISCQPFKQVCIFRDNMISPLLLPTKLIKYATLYNNAFILVEANDNGHTVCASLFYDMEYDNQYTEMKAGKIRIGVEMNKKIKAIGCSNIKDLIEEGKLHIVDRNTIAELSSFVAKGSSYAADGASHDDLVMNLVLFGWFSSTEYFKALTDIELRDEIYKEQMREIEDELVPFGIIQDGTSLNPEVDALLSPENYESFGGTRWRKAIDGY